MDPAPGPRYGWPVGARHTVRQPCPSAGARAPCVRLIALAAVGACVFVACTSVCAIGAQASSQTCATLRGKRLLRSDAIKVVEHTEAARGVVYSCGPPRGRVRRLGVASDDTFSSAYQVTVLALAGPWVALGFRNQIGFHTFEEIGKACQAASGRCYRFFAEGFPEPSLEAEVPQLRFSLQRVVINEFGQLALALANYDTVQILGFSSGGVRLLLDSGPQAQIPSASLRFEGHTVRWLDAGEPRSAAP
jgi:hypothetical protein